MSVPTAVANLIERPRWRADDLGKPIPEAAHAVSAALPRWADVVGYEEGERRVIDAMAGGYPRFVCHRFCQRLFAALNQRRDDGRRCRAFCSEPAARRFVAFMRQRGDGRADLVDLPDGRPHAAHYAPNLEDEARAYWQHTGEGISSRDAEACLAGRPLADDARAKAGLRERIASLAGVAPDDVWLAPTGMAAMYLVHRALRRLAPDKPAAQFGFPYVDTLKILQTFGPRAHFHPCGSDAELHTLDRQLQAGSASGLFTELPSNPLLRSPDLGAMADLARRHGAPLIVDDTLATWFNVDLAGVADLTWSSLTKYFSGVGDVTGGCVVVRPESPWADRLRAAIGAAWDDGLTGAEAALLERNGGDFAERMPRFNAGAAALAEHLVQHERVGRVHYPSLRDEPGYRGVARPSGGFGGLLSFELAEPTAAPAVYDALRVNKGPNLGANYTLACPFTLLAHYRELDWAESCGVSRWLIRVSVGLEPIDDLLARFDEALAAGG